MKRVLKISVVLLAAVLGACAKEPPPPHSVDEFVENSILLEATMVRCAQDRSKMKYEADCLNAREAVNRIAKAKEEERKKELEAQFERKRRALRRTQEAAAQARRQAAEEQRRREEAEYLGIYEVIPGDESGQAGSSDPAAQAESNAPAAAIEPNAPAAAVESGTPAAQIDPPSMELDAGAAADTSATDIDAVREELRRRQDGGN